MKNTSMIMITAIFITFSCAKKQDKEEMLTIPKTNYIGTELNIDGYYYRLSADNMGNTAYEIYFFYRDGTVLFGGFPLQSQLFARETQFSNGEYYNQAIMSKTNWGRFQIINESIRFERWFPSSGGPARVYQQSGIILNDSTFHITTSTPSHGDGTPKVIDHTYHFKKFVTKPDSVNTYTN